MSWEDELSKAIIARVQADTGSGGLWETNGTNKLNAIFAEQLADDQPTDGKAYVMFEFARQDTADTAAKRSIEIDLRTHMFASMDLSKAKLWTLVARLRGNWQANGGTPSYGLDRWTPTTTSFDVTALGHQSSISQHEWESGVYHVIDEYILQVMEQ